jgi:hypothetical protein
MEQVMEYEDGSKVIWCSPDYTEEDKEKAEKAALLKIYNLFKDKK